MPGQASEVAVIWILYALVLCLGLVYYLKKFSRYLYLATLFAIPFLGELIVSIRRPIFYDRTLIWTSIPLFLVLAAGIVQLRFRLLMIVVLGILVINNLFSTGDYYRFTQNEDWGSAAAYVARYIQNDDLILFNATWSQIPFDYYFKTYEQQYSLHVVKHGVPVDLFDSGILEPKMTDTDIPRLTSLISGRKSVWLVYSHNTSTDPMGLIPQTIASEMNLIYQRDFSGGQVQLYIVP